MGKSRFYQNGLISTSICMIIMIIIYWYYVRTHYFSLPSAISGPQASHHPTISHSMPKHVAVNSKGNSSLSVIDTFLNQLFKGTSEHRQSNRDDKNTLTAEEKKKRQDSRKQLVHDFCNINSTLDFPGKNRTFDNITSSDLKHLIVDDNHGIIYCYVPKVACSHWKRIMIVLSESLLVNGVPYRDSKAIPNELLHDRRSYLTFYNLSRDQMEVKLKNYTKFLFVRDPFVRLISAFRDKLETQREYFYQMYSTVILKRYGNYSNPPATVDEAFRSGIRPSFSNFIQYLLDPDTEKNMSFNEHWQQIYRLCHPCQINYDFIGKLETVEEDATQLLRILQVDDIIHFPPSYDNKTVSSWLQEWFYNIPYESYRELYKLYEPDFKLFGYSKPEALA